MKIKSTYVLKQVAGKHIVVPTLEATLNLNGIITLNESGKFLFEQLMTSTTTKKLVEQMVLHYDVAPDVAKKDIEAFIEVLRSKDLLDES